VKPADHARHPPGSSLDLSRRRDYQRSVFPSVNLLFETLFFFLPLLGFACIPLGIAVLGFDSLLYSRWVPVMRHRMSRRKWPAVLIAAAPLLGLATFAFAREMIPAPLVPLLSSPWPIVFGGATCIAFAACWLKLPRDAEEDDAPPARSLTAEWLLALAILTLNYLGLRLIPLGW